MFRHETISHIEKCLAARGSGHDTSPRAKATKDGKHKSGESHDTAKKALICYPKAARDDTQAKEPTSFAR
jgi:hypothetical protein